MQRERTGKANAWLDNRETERCAALCAHDQQLLEHAVDKLGLSARAYHRILRVARTIADLAGSAAIHTAHLSEAIGYRQLDRTPI
jgi:magnesium chelatase family protein